VFCYNIGQCDRPIAFGCTLTLLWRFRGRSLLLLW